jgi:glycosyltransferase involved in cell wall biosynthesis
VFVQDQARLVARRHRVVVLFSEGPDAGVRRLFALRDAREDGLRVLRLRHRPVPLPRAASALTVLGLSGALSRLRREGFAPDVLHAHTLEAAIPAVMLGRLHGIPVVASEHWSGFPLGTLTRWQRVLARRVFEAADAVCPVSESLRRAIQPYAPRARMHVVGNVVDTTLFAPPAGEREAHDGPPRLLAVALLSDKKGLAVLLDALARRAAAGRSPVSLDVVGDGPERPVLDARARDLGLDGAVRFHGLESRDAVARRMAESDLFVLPSHVETFGVALVEALAAGLPVVATDVGVAGEIVDEHAGIIVPPGDADALAAGIDRAVEGLGRFDPAASSALVRARYGPDAVAAAWDAVYATVTGGRNGGDEKR